MKANIKNGWLRYQPNCNSSLLDFRINPLELPLEFRGCHLNIEWGLPSPVILYYPTLVYDFGESPSLLDRMVRRLCTDVAKYEKLPVYSDESLLSDLRKFASGFDLEIPEQNKRAVHCSYNVQWKVHDLFGMNILTWDIVSFVQQFTPFSTPPQQPKARVRWHHYTQGVKP